MLRRALSLGLASMIASACSYDFEHARMPRIDAGAIVDSSIEDAGPNVLCDPIADTGCPSSMLTCSAELDPDRRLTARCTLPGTSTSGAGCAGPGDCARELLCLSTPSGSATCTSVCTGTQGCPGEQACDRTAALYTLGAETVYRCR